MTPVQLVEQLLAVVPTRDAAAFTAFFADDAAFELPFGPGGAPVRIEGREAIRAALAQGWSATSAVQVHAIHPRIYATDDPEVVIVENEVEVTRPGQERTRVRSAVNVIHVRDGAVVLFRDYLDPAPMAAAAARAGHGSVNG
ncbi:nuclear transport factor 2 family protein [Nocardia asteroides]|uniref:nuclear transport factor 2 family protein n=1 Tax=Nocardia asteroides TaxID=1824 RepID=UPI001E497346|nr:nuclear transport factor 2 family protein [Nocardia asteroides]UGT52903.1 nuclear transport factor 2 family protein [Nocardia asteroides]